MMSIDTNVANVCERLVSRSAVGLRKYGVTTERTDLSLHEWLQHLQDELLDAAVYVERLKRDIACDDVGVPNNARL